MGVVFHGRHGNENTDCTEVREVAQQEFKISDFCQRKKKYERETSGTVVDQLLLFRRTLQFECELHKERVCL